jgi:hydroxymethylbilane synthase
MKLRIGTRGSQLALWQAHHIAGRLRGAHAGLEVELEVIKTSGDRIQDRALYEVGGKGLFVKEIEEALLEGRVDLAVHSMKDVPGSLPEGLTLAAMPTRANPFDAFVSELYQSVMSLPEGACVGTTSLRRRFQLLALRPDLKVLPIRGNVDTRLRKLKEREGGLDAILLAVSGLERLSLGGVITQVLSPPEFLPAIGQGALGLEIRAEDAGTRGLLEALRDPATERCVLAERGVLAELEGDCHLPVACLATEVGARLVVRARLGLPDASQVVDCEVEGDGSAPEALGRGLGRRLLEGGGAALMEALARGAGLP